MSSGKPVQHDPLEVRMFKKMFPGFVGSGGDLNDIPVVSKLGPSKYSLPSRALIKTRQRRKRLNKIAKASRRKNRK